MLESRLDFEIEHRHGPKMTIRVTLFLSIFLWSSGVCAMTQMPDILIEEGKEHALPMNPMETYFERFPQRRPKVKIRSAALKRGYQAFFEIHRGTLVLKDIKVQSLDPSKPSSYGTRWVTALETVVPDGHTLSIDWFTGLLVLPTGAIRTYVHTGYTSRYAHYRLLEIREGQVMEERNLNAQEYDAFTAQQFAAYRETKDYRERYARMEREGKSPAFIEAYLKDTVLEKTKTFLKTADTP